MGMNYSCQALFIATQLYRHCAGQLSSIDIVLEEFDIFYFQCYSQTKSLNLGFYEIIRQPLSFG